MRIQKFLAVLALLLCSFFTGWSQHPLQVTVIPKPPFPPQPGAYFDNPEKFCQVIISNQSSSSQAFYLGVKLEMIFPDAVSAQTPVDRPPAQPITLGPHQTRVLNFMDFESQLRHLNLDHIITKGIDFNNYSQAPNLLPEGTYQLCITAYNYKDGFGSPMPLSAPGGTSCATIQICYAASAPVLTSPLPCMIDLPVDDFGPVNPLMVSWMPPAFNCGGPPATFRYNLKIVEVMPGQNLQFAMDFNPTALEIPDIMTTSVPLDTLLFPGVFRPGERYAIQITASESFGNNQVVLENQGMSPICTFTWGGTPDDDLPQDPPPTEPDDPEEPEEPFDPPVVIDDTSESTDPQCMAEAPANQNPFDGNLNGQQVQIGLFTMNVTQANENNGQWTGIGTVDWNPRGVPLGIWVEFENIRVNTDLQVYEGVVVSQQEDELSQYVPEIVQKQIDWAQSQLDYATEMASQLNISVPSVYNDKMQQYTNYIGEASKLIDQAQGNIRLPLNLESTLPVGGIDIGIVGMVFTPHVARMNTFSAFHIPESAAGVDKAQWLAFVGHGMCFTPDIVVSTTEANLFLAADFNVVMGGGFELTFKSASVLGDNSDGSFISWNNEGFDEGRLSFDLTLPSKIRGENEDGTPNNERIAVSFETWFSDWNDWIAEGSIPTFQVEGLSGFGFSADRIVYDHSVIRNPEGITFPQEPGTGEDYGAGGVQWKGLWLDNLQVQLPSQFESTEAGSPRGSFTLTQLLYDEKGVTFDILGLNPLQTGVMGGCAFSIDTVSINMYQSDLRWARINGGITLPVAQDPLQYAGNLNWDNQGEMDYSFYIRPTDDIAMPAWLATMSIHEASELLIQKDPHGTKVHFLLHGDISLKSEYSIEVPYVFSMPGIRFENFGIANRNPVNQEPEFYLSAGDWSLASAQKSIGPFNVSIETPRPFFSGGEFGMEIKAGFSIGGVDAFSCEASVDIVGSLDWNIRENMLPRDVGLKEARLSEVAIEGDFGPVAINGKLKFYYDDATFGNGMRGEVSASFQPSINIQAVAQFGKTMGSDGYNYWYVDAMAKFGSGIPIVYPLAISGFGGGVYYNMTRANVTDDTPADEMIPDDLTNPVIPDMDNLNASASGVQYVPQQGSIGFKAGVTLALNNAVGGGKVFNGSLWLGASWKNNSFSQLYIEGDAYMVTNYPDNSNSLLDASLSMVYDNHAKTLDFDINIEADFLIGRATVPIVFHANALENTWYLMLGDPHNQRIEATIIDLDITILKAKLTAHCYLAFGNALPNPNLPPPPPQIVQYLNLSNLDQHRVDIGSKPPGGMLFGAGLDGDLEVNLLIYLKLQAIAGFDVSLIHIEGDDFICNGEPAGFHGWYGQGQVYGYFHGEVGLSIRTWFFRGSVTLGSFTAGAFLKGGMPDPFWAYGKARVEGQVLGGLIRIRTTAEIDVGERCYPPMGDPLANIRVLEDIQPGYSTFYEAQQGVDESIFAIPRITANLNLSEGARVYPIPIEIPPSDENIHGEIREYMFYIETVRLHRNISDTLDPADDFTFYGTHMDWNTGAFPNATQVIVEKSESFLPETFHAIRVMARAKQKINGEWKDPTFKENGQIVQRRRREVLKSYFRTGPRPNNFENNMALTYPLDGQRYFPYRENFFLVLNSEQQYLWQDPDYPLDVYISRVRNVENNPFPPQKLTSMMMLMGGRVIRYNNTVWTQLEPQQVYRLHVIRRNLAHEQEYLAQMAEERRRLEIRNLLNNTGYTITQPGQLSYDDLYNANIGGYTPVNGENMQLQPINVGNVMTNPALAPAGQSPGGQSPAGPSLAGIQSPAILSPGGIQEPTLLQPGQIPGNIHQQQPGNGQNIINPLQGGGGGPVNLTMMTLEEYDQHYRADTVDFREQTLLEQFDAPYNDTLFTITFATSQYGRLSDKIQAYGPLIIASSGSGYAESYFAREPFEVYDLYGMNAFQATSRGYMGEIPPLLKFYQIYNPQNALDNFWFNKFNKRTHDLNDFTVSGNMPGWRPWPLVSVVSNPQPLIVNYGDTEHNRWRPYFPQASLSGNEHYPGMNRNIVTGASTPLSFSEANSTNPIISLMNFGNQHLRYRYVELVETMFMEDLMAMRNFAEEFQMYVEQFTINSWAANAVPDSWGYHLYHNSNAHHRRTTTQRWIDEQQEIIGTGTQNQTIIRMPAYQFSWLFQHKEENPGLWQAATESFNILNLIGSIEYNELHIKHLDIINSINTGDGSGWQYVMGEIGFFHPPPTLKFNILAP